MNRRFFATALFLAPLGCKDDTADKVGDAFVDRYFVESDQKRALELATGPAQLRLQEELKLVQQIRNEVGYGPAAARPSSVHYTRTRTEVQADTARMQYEIRIKDSTDPPRHANIGLKKDGGRWRVSFYAIVERDAKPQSPARDGG